MANVFYTDLFLLNPIQSDIIKLYSEEGYSLHEIAEFFDLKSKLESVVSYIHKIVKNAGVNRNVNTANKNPRRQIRRVNTNLKNYGVGHNFSKNHPSRIKWEKNLLEEEGIINVFQRPEVKRKIAKTIIEKYGVNNASLLSRKGRENFSRPHQFIFEMLNWFIDFNIKTEKKLFFLDSYFSYDVFIENTNLLIEVNGDYWHANPLLYKENDIMLYGTEKSTTAKTIWERDKIKLEHALNQGYKTFVVWENDLINHSFETCNKLLDWIKENNEDCKNQINQKNWPTDTIRYNRRKKSQLFCK